MSRPFHRALTVPRVGGAIFLALGLAATGHAGQAAPPSPSVTADQAAAPAPPPPPPPPPFTAQEAAIASKVLADSPSQGLNPPTAGEDLVAASLRYARAQHGWRLNPPAVDPDWTVRPQPYDAAAALAAARAAGALADWFASQPPPLRGYYDLVQARAHYRAIEEAGGWTRIPPGPPLRTGSTGAAVTALRGRLAAEGYAAGAAPDASAADPFDSALETAVRLFQTRHDLAETGIVDARTRSALAISPKEIIDIVDANLERWRWAPRVFPADRIDVNIANEGLTLWRANEVTFTMRVVVGDQKHRTPMLAADARAVEFNPPWIVPAKIAATELYPKEARQRGYLARHGFTKINGQLVQKAGPLSALGKVKFDLDDPYAIYLHDTPSRKFFARDARDLSHGCIRLDHPVDLAEALLGPQGWTRDQIQAAIDAGATRWVKIVPRVRTFLLYETAIGHDDGIVSLHSDHYGWDGELNDALRNGPPHRVDKSPAKDEQPVAAAP